MYLEKIKYNHMNKKVCVSNKEEKISCLLFSCPMIEEINSCSLSNFRMLTSSQDFWIEERLEEGEISHLLSVKYLCFSIARNGL